MPKDLTEVRRAAAEQRVREHDKKRMERLTQIHEQSRELDEDAQTGALDHMARKERQLKDDRREALRVQEEQWEQERKKLAARPTMAPVFGMGVPSKASVELEYQRKRLAYEQRREETIKHYDDRLTGLAIDRSSLTEKHAAQNERRDRMQAQQRDELAQDSARTFEARVEKEMQRAERALTKELTKSRGKGHEM
jgi:hypothetical protein